MEDIAFLEKGVVKFTLLVRRISFIEVILYIFSDARVHSESLDAFEYLEI